MTIKNVKRSQLKAPAHNPCPVFDAAEIEGLAASINTDGLMQNLVVIPWVESYKIISGERRFRALTLLAQRGDIIGSYKVPVQIRTKLSKQAEQFPISLPSCTVAERFISWLPRVPA